MIIAIKKIGVKVIMNLCQCSLDDSRVHDEWKTNMIVIVNVPMFKPKGDMMSLDPIEN